MTKYTKMLSRVITISTYAIIFCVIGNMVMPALIIESVQAQAIIGSSNAQPKLSASDSIMQKRVSGLKADLEAVSKSSSYSVSTSNKSEKSVLDKYINRIGKAKLKKLSDTYDKLSEAGKKKFLENLSDVELSAFVAGVFMPYEQTTTLTKNEIVKNTAKSTSTMVSAASDPSIGSCAYTTYTNTGTDSQGSKIFQYRFTIYSCYTNLYNKVYGNNTFYDGPVVLYVKSGWNYSRLGGSLWSCTPNDRTYYSCTAGYELRMPVFWWNVYRDTVMTIYRELNDSPNTVKVRTHAW